ncbi:MAG: LCP family protein [Clostridia bacterium]|nr:LCP family protein [Clostridia bacterium]
MADEKRRSTASNQGAPRKTGKKKKKSSPVRIVIKVLLVLFLLVLLAFLFVLGRFVYKEFTTEDKPITAPPVDHDTTAKDQLSKVSYYMIGVMGESSTDPLEMLSLVCVDKEKDTVDVLQIPVATYIGKTEGWDVTTFGAVWASPKELTWCDLCRHRVLDAAEINEENVHIPCGQVVTTKKGSASGNLIDIFNDQYSMPVDAFFLFPRKAFVQMVNAVGGVDVELAEKLKVDDVTYDKGVQTLSGEAALYYALEFGYKDTPATDLQRLLHQRQVFTALFQRLTALSETALLDEVFDPVMSSSTPIRVDNLAQGRESLLAGMSNKTAEDTDYEEAMSALIAGMADWQLTNMRYHVLPGEAAKNGTQHIYSVHAEDLLALLNGHFNPYGVEMGIEDLEISEVRNSKESDTQTATWDTVTVPQDGSLEETDESDE